MGRAVEAWERLAAVLGGADVADLLEVYGPDAVFLEPFNPPHRGNLLIQAYVKDWLVGKEGVTVTPSLVVESSEGDAVGVEWTISYTAAGRRWNDLPRATFLRLDADGRIAHHRDYA